MMMQMLAAGGVPALSDGVRTPDDSNPRGYFELEVVKALEREGDRAWLERARGHAVKILSPLLPHLPETYTYQVVFMDRALDEVIASQNAMLARRGEPTDRVPERELVATYDAHLRKVRAFLDARSCFETMTMRYHDVVANPLAEARRVNHFLGGHLDADRMAGAVDRRLHRHRG